MKMIKLIGCAGVASVALSFSTNSMILADTTFKNGIAATTQGNAESSIHRVNHALVLTTSYTKKLPSGYKWGQPVEVGDSQGNADWSGSLNKGGSKWGRSSTAEQAGSKWGRN